MRLDGMDGDFAYFSVRSRSRQELWHTVTIDRREWFTSCTCEHAEFNRPVRTMSLLDFDAFNGCWHQIAVQELVYDMVRYMARNKT